MAERAAGTGPETVEDRIVEFLPPAGLPEAFLTALRVRRANIKARALLVAKAKAFKESKEAGQAKDTPDS